MKAVFDRMNGINRIENQSVFIRFILSILSKAAFISVQPARVATEVPPPGSRIRGTAPGRSRLVNKSGSAGGYVSQVSVGQAAQPFAHFRFEAVFLPLEPALRVLAGCAGPVGFV
ncbi:hypothetical protein R5W23_002905 [Gemmata sp. JC673]|uniref:Uncharacterized protein n=1 Tax=Gemmata algarum TaxID=2975278 RepID=A0ABU5F6Y4_9BACT|nr:hypothetical protein [Gemmata algarum]MDY3561626.1 hypothetical protein [Gemmata algarum]